ncbi:unnamed protein product [Polarella glacialis]|uniref:Uncharacterized protein n=1 Tax=Polarella glacialis TaxID=89957 RepID=A0A813IRS1_POLGL|nr:unnamed protein product [Polarella glacialis]
MLRTVLRPLGAAACRRAAPTFSAPAFRAAPVALRSFAAAAAPARKPKVEDGTLEGRYATALFMASNDRLDKVYADLIIVRTMMEESKEFKLVVETPGIDPVSKAAVFDAVCKKAGLDDAVLNFMKVLIENRRAKLLLKMINIFEGFYRAEKGLVLCKVSTAEALSAAQMTQVKDAMQKRAEKGSTLIMEYTTNVSLLGGMVVKMGEAVLDYSVHTKLERLQTQLLQPVN